MSTKGQHFHNKLAQLCYDKYNSLPKSGKPKQNEWTILSGIIKEEENHFEVVALGTGSKCIGQDKLSKDGDVLNDSHAEIMCRRGFLRYIYEKMLAQTDNTFVFDPETQKFAIDNNVKFHFFTSHVACGDAAIFPKETSEDVGSCLNQANELSLKRGSDTALLGAEPKRIKLGDNIQSDIFRTGAKCLESDKNQDLHGDGASYHVTGVVRTKPGRGCLTLSVSCSDKLAKWCHLGVQGALLSVLLTKPIYLSSFTIAGETPFCEQALRRALFDRLGTVVLEPPYHRHELIVGQSELLFSSGKTEGKSPCPCSIVWLKNSKGVEVAVDGRRQGMTKKQIKSAGALKICKRELMKCFIEVMKKLDIRLEGAKDLHTLTYKQTKLCAKEYERNWILLKKYFKVWTTKDEDLLKFMI